MDQGDFTSYGARMSIRTGVSGMHTDQDRCHVIDLVPSRGLGGSGARTPLFEAHVGESTFVAWEIGDGRMACAPASCPHRPALGPILHTRGIIEDGNVVCTRHANVYSGVNGECIAAAGPGDPGELVIRRGTRVGDRLVLDHGSEGDPTVFHESGRADVHPETGGHDGGTVTHGAPTMEGPHRRPGVHC